MPRRRRRGKWKAAGLVLAGCIAVLVWLLMVRPDLTDEIAQGEELDRALTAWAVQRGLKPRLTSFSQTIEIDGSTRWLYIERAYWIPPRRPREAARHLAALREELALVASAHGLTLKREQAGRGEFSAVLLTADGRETLRLSLRPRVRVALIIDDLGYSLPLARRIMALPCKLTIAVIPLTPRAQQVANLAARSGKEVFIHMPMRPESRLPGDSEYELGIEPGLGYEEVRDRIRRAHDSLPGAVGLNNHEGSLATIDRVLMTHVMSVVKDRGLVFIDSATSPKSVAWKVAKASGVKWARRDVFLDAEYSRAFVESSFSKLMAMARKYGEAIAIGHPLTNTLDMLERRIPEAQREGIEFVYATTLTRLY